MTNSNEAKATIETFKHVEKTSIGNRYGKHCKVCGKFFTIHIAPGIPTAWADRNYPACPDCSTEL